MTGTTSDRCDADWLSERLEERRSRGELLGRGPGDAIINGQLILVDCRPSADYGTVHIDGAISLSLPALIQRRLLRGNLAMPAALGYCSSDGRGSKVNEEQWRSNLIVLYDDDMTLTSQDVTSDDVTNGNTTSKLVPVLLKQLKKEGYSVCYLSGGLKQFRARYPHLCMNRCDQDEDSSLQTGFRNLRLSTAVEMEPEEPMTSFDGKTIPVEVLPHLYLGDAKNASDLECLEGKGIRYILNVTPNVPNAFETKENFKYLQIPINDHWSQNLTNYFPQAITFIDEGRRLNTGVLVHCLAGISRSVTVTVAYLMYSKSFSLNDAYDYVKQRKPNVSPNLTFMGQLLDFENSLKVDGRRCLCACHSSSSSSSSFSPPPLPPPSSSSSSLSCSCCRPASSSSTSSRCLATPPSDDETESRRQDVAVSNT